jgi:hypothetical protein
VVVMQELLLVTALPPVHPTVIQAIRDQRLLINVHYLEGVWLHARVPLDVPLRYLVRDKGTYKLTVGINLVLWLHGNVRSRVVDLYDSTDFLWKGEYFLFQSLVLGLVGLRSLSGVHHSSKLERRA